MQRFGVAKLLHKTLDELDGMTEWELRLWPAFCEWEAEQLEKDRDKRG